MHARNADCSGVRLSWEMGLNISAISSITAKRWIKNDEDDFDIGVKNGVEHSPGELLWLCSRVVYTLKFSQEYPPKHCPPTLTSLISSLSIEIGKARLGFTAVF